MTAPGPGPGAEPPPVTLGGRSVLVTGATGKVGRRLVGALLAQGARVTVLTRDPERATGLWPDAAVQARRGDLTRPETLDGLLTGIDSVFHLASYAPAPGEPDIYEAPAHWPVTALGTRALAALAAASAVERLVYVSSVMAMGSRAGARGRPADETDAPEPDTLYGRAKLAAEHAVLDLGRTRPMHVAVLRLPMVYGLPGEGNLARLVDAVARGRFPPWPRIPNRRSAVHADDAAAAAILAATHPRAAGQVYLVTDGRTYSTRWIYEQVRAALGLSVPAWGVPRWALASAALAGTLLEAATGRAVPLTRVALDKLTGDAWYASAKLARELGFEPHYVFEREILRLAQDYRTTGR